MKFYLEIELGNDAMSTRLDLAAAVKEVARKIMPDTEDMFDLLTAFSKPIYDINGNRVGKFEIKE